MSKFIVIEGLIGVGKTTLCRILEKEWNAVEWPIRRSCFEGLLGLIFQEANDCVEPWIQMLDSGIGRGDQFSGANFFAADQVGEAEPVIIRVFRKGAHSSFHIPPR